MSNKEITIIQVNDSHGYFDLHQELFWAGNHATYRKTGGYGRLARVLNNVREEKPKQVLAFDCGDTIHGTYAAVQSQGQALVPILNELDFDAMTAHWEFAYGPQQLKDIMAQLNYPLLAINCYNEETDELVFDPYIIKRVNGLKVGVIGIAATIVDKVMPQHFSEDIYFTLGNEELPGYIKELKTKENVDLVVVISHLGFAQEVKLAREVEGVDVLLSGHTHNRLYRPTEINNTIIIQSGCHGSFVGRLDLTVANKKIVAYEHELIEVRESLDPEPVVEQLVRHTLKPYESKLSQVLGYTETPLNRNTVLEATMDNFLLQALLDYTGAEMAFSNGWRYGAPIIPGPITVNDLWNIIPVNPPVSMVELTGKELWTMMEENLERTFAPDPYNQMGGYVKRCLGINLYFKIENEEGERIQRLFVQGQPVSFDKTYQVAFVTTQGVPAKYGNNRRTLAVNAIEALKQYLAKQNEPINADIKGTIVAV